MRRLVPALALMLASCAGGGVTPPEGSSAPPSAGSACAGLGEPVVVGSVAEPALAEISGLVASRRHPGILWVHNDSDAGARLWAITISGETAATLDLVGAEAFDWEAASLGPGPGGDHLYVADTGDNLENRPYAVLYRVPEPAEVTGSLRAAAQSVRVTYPDGPQNVEAMFVDPATGDAYLISKEVLAAAAVYRIPASAWELGEAVAQPAGSLDSGLIPVTAADLSADGSVLAVRTYWSVLLFARPPGAALTAAWAAPPCQAPAPPEEQGEAMAWYGGGYLTIGEDSAAPVYRVSR